MNEKSNPKTGKIRRVAKKKFSIEEDIKQFFPKVSHMGGINPCEGSWINSNSAITISMQDSCLQNTR